MVKQQRPAFESLSLPEEEIFLALGYGGTIPDSHILTLINEVLSEVSRISIPRYIYRVEKAGISERNRIKVNDLVFSPGGIILSYLPGMSHVCIFAATAGKEYETYLRNLRKEGDIVKEFVADAIGSVIAEACVVEIGKELNAYKEFKHSFPYSPGYCGWDIREQKKLFSLFPEEPCGIHLSESCLMTPVKSVSGFIGLGEELKPQPYRCEICNNIHCYKRKERKNDKHEKVGSGH